MFQFIFIFFFTQQNGFKYFESFIFLFDGCGMNGYYDTGSK